MKTEMRWRTMLLTMMVAALSVFAFSCDDDDKDNGPDVEDNWAVTGSASGAQVVPAVSGTGTGAIVGTYNPNTRVLTYTNTWAGLTGVPTGGGFYIGGTTENGTLIGTEWTYPGATGVDGTISGTMTLTLEQEDELLSGDMYYVYETSANPGGEVRGRIMAEEMD